MKKIVFAFILGMLTVYTAFDVGWIVMASLYNKCDQYEPSDRLYECAEKRYPSIVYLCDILMKNPLTELRHHVLGWYLEI
jgi:hypothetical protein